MKSAAALPRADRLPVAIKIALVACAALAFIVVLSLAPIAMPPYLDFQVLYHADLGLLRGIAVYDHAGQVAMIAQLAHVMPAEVNVLPFPYPPWYALSTLWLAWLPIEVAVRAWLAINLVLLLLAAWLLTEGWPPVKRLVGMGLSVFFLPVLGSLFVGQYVFPVLFGAALMIFAVRREQAVLAALAAALLTFKPHLGAFVLLAVLVYLWLRKDAFGRRLILAIVAVGVLLFAIGFLADPAWPVSYLRSLLGFRQDAGVASCGLCASLPVMLADLFARNAGLALALPIGAIILVAAVAVWLRQRPRALNSPEFLVAVSVLVVLLSSPYLLNYDFVLLLIPMALIAARASHASDWVLLGAVYLLPFIALGLLNRQGNFVFSLAAIALLVRLFLAAQALDGSAAPA